MAWSIGARFKAFREDLLPNTYGIKWNGTPEEFTQLVIDSIPKIRDIDARIVMDRFYIMGEAQVREPFTHRPVGEDQRFYQLLQRGRAALIPVIEFTGKCSEVD